MTFSSHLFQGIAFSAKWPIGIIVTALILNTLLGLMTGQIRSNKPFDLVTHSKFCLGLIILILGASMGVFFRDHLYRNFTIMIDGLTYFIFPYFLLMVMFALFRWISGRNVGTGFRIAAVIGGACAFSLVLSMIVGARINAWRMAEVRSYVARAAPVLEEIKAREGAYPSTLPVSSLGEPPLLLRSFGDYSSDGSGYRFEYLDEPAGWAGGRNDFYTFDSLTRQWTNDSP